MSDYVMVFYRERDHERPPLSLILPRLYLGAETDVTQDCLSSRGISHVLSVSRCSPQPSFLPCARFHRVPIDDSLRDELLPWIPAALRFIDDAMSAGGSVLVHCYAGISRSPALAVAYIMHRLGMDLDHAYRFVKERRPSISPNFNFLGQLQHFQGTLALKVANGNPLVQPIKSLDASTNENTRCGPAVPVSGNQSVGCHDNSSVTKDFAAVAKVYGESSDYGPEQRSHSGEIVATATTGQSQHEQRRASQQLGLSLSSKLRTLTLALNHNHNQNQNHNHNQNDVHSPWEASTPSPNGPEKSTSKPAQLQIPTSKPIQLQIPTSKPAQLQIPTSKPIQLQIPTSKPAQLQIPTSKPIQLQIPTSKPIQLQIPTSKPAQLQIPTSKPAQLQIPSGFASLSDKRKNLTLSLSSVSAIPPNHHQGALRCNSDRSASQQPTPICTSNAANKRKTEAAVGVKRRVRKASADTSSVQSDQTPREATVSHAKAARPDRSSSQNKGRGEREGRTQGKGKTSRPQSVEKGKPNTAQKPRRDHNKGPAESWRGSTQSQRSTVVCQEVAPETALPASAVEAQDGVDMEQGVLSPLGLTVNKLLGWGERMLLGVLLGPRIKVGQAALPYRC